MIRFKLGKQRITIENDAIAAWIVMLIVLEVLALFTSPLSFFGAVFSGAIVATLHFVGQFVHQMGHATAARLTGYPMKGMRFSRVFSHSEYPKGQKGLTDGQHVQRALGGVVGAFVWVLVMGAAFLATRGAAPAWEWIFAVALLDAAVIFLVSAIYSDGVMFIRRKGWR
jgi:hypothetical protein